MWEKRIWARGNHTYFKSFILEWNATLELLQKASDKQPFFLFFYIPAGHGTPIAPSSDDGMNVVLINSSMIFFSQIIKSEVTFCSSSHVFVFSSSSKLLATCITFCWSVVELIAVLFRIELYCTSWRSTFSEDESSMDISLISFSGFVKFMRSVMKVLILSVEFPRRRSVTYNKHKHRNVVMKMWIWRAPEI